jgi:outer membrane protein, heavy metal efflux system
MLKKLLPLTVLIAVSAAFSSAFALTMPEALAKVDLQGNVKLAKAELNDAKANLDRQLSDPLITKPSELQARQRLELAQNKVAAAQRAAASSITSSFTQALGAQKQVQLAQKSLELSTLSLKISDIRQKNGSGTALDLRDSQRALEDAKKNANSAQDGLDLAIKSLKNAVGEFDGKLTSPSDLPELPDEKMIDTILNRSSNLLQTRQGLDSLKLQRSVQDPSYTAQSQIDATDKQLGDTAQNLSDLQDNERIAVRSSYNSVISAYKGLAVASKALENANDKLDNDQKRFKGGLISQVQLTQTELSTVQTELSLVQARNSYLTSYYSFLNGSSAGR